jgi:hypothetical protein
MFAEIEGLCAAAIDHARDMIAGAARRRYSAEEIAVLQGTASVDDNGKPRIDHPRIKTIPTIRFALRLVGRGARQKDIDYGGSDWQAMQAAIKIRDRLVHPKTGYDLLVADDELDPVEGQAAPNVKSRLRMVPIMRAYRDDCDPSIAGHAARHFPQIGTWLIIASSSRRGDPDGDASIRSAGRSSEHRARRVT